MLPALPAIAATGVVGVTIGLVVPVMSLSLDARGHSGMEIGLNTTAQFVGLMLFSFAVPGLIARLGLVRTMAGALVMTCGLMLLFPVFDGWTGWLVLRFVFGCAEAALFIASETWINQSLDDRIRGRVIGLYGAALAAGVAAGPLLIEVTGVAGAAPFLAGAAITAAALVPLALAGGSAPAITGTSTPGAAFAMIRLMPLAGIAALAFGLMDAAAIGLLPVYGRDIGLEIPEAARLVTALVVGGIALQWPLGWLADHVDRARLLVALAAIGGISIALVPLAIGHWLLYVLLFVFGGVVASLWTIPIILLGARFKGPDLAAGNVGLSVLFGIGSSAGPTISGLAMSAWPPHGLIAAMAAGMALVAAAGLALSRRT